MKGTFRGAPVIAVLATGLIIAVAVAAEDVGCAVRRLPEQGPAVFTMEVDIAALKHRKVVISRSDSIPGGHAVRAEVRAAASKAHCAGTAGATQRMMVSLKGPWAEIAVTAEKDVHVVFRDGDSMLGSVDLQAGASSSRTFQF